MKNKRKKLKCFFVNRLHPSHTPFLGAYVYLLNWTKVDWQPQYTSVRQTINRTRVSTLVWSFGKWFSVLVKSSSITNIPYEILYESDKNIHEWQPFNCLYVVDTKVTYLLSYNLNSINLFERGGCEIKYALDLSVLMDLFISFE